MSTQTATIQLRVNSSVKEQAQALFEKMGMDISSAIRLFLNKVIKTKSIPFTVRTVNGYTPEYEQILINELAELKKSDSKGYKSFEEFNAALHS